MSAASGDEQFVEIVSPKPRINLLMIFNYPSSGADAAWRWSQAAAPIAKPLDRPLERIVPRTKLRLCLDVLLEAIQDCLPAYALLLWRMNALGVE